MSVFLLGPAGNPIPEVSMSVFSLGPAGLASLVRFFDWGGVPATSCHVLGSPAKGTDRSKSSTTFLYFVSG